MKTFVAWTLAGAAILSGRADALPVAYVAQPYAGTLTALNTLHGEATADIPLALPFQSQFVRLSPDGARAYLASGLDVSVVDMRNSRILFTFELSSCTWGLCSIHGVELSDDGNLLYLATDDLLTYQGGLYVVDASSGTVLNSFELAARPQTMVRGSNGLLYLADESSDTLVVFDPEKRKATEVHLRSLTSHIVVSPDAKLLFVSTYEKGENPGTRVDVFDGSSFELVASLPVPDYSPQIVVAPDGKTVYVVVGGTGVIVFDTTRFSVVATIAEERPGGLIVWPDGTSVYLLKAWSDQVLDIDTGDYTIRRTFEVPMIGGSDVFSRDGTQAYFPAFFDPRGLSVFDRPTDKVSTILEGSGPNQVAVRDDGRFVYGIGDQLVWVIDTATNAKVGSFSLNDPPEEDSLPPPNRRKYLAGNPITMLDLERNRVARHIPLPDGIQVGAVTPSADGQRLYAGTTGFLTADEDVCSLGHVVVLDAATGVILDQMALPQTGLPVAVALDPQEKNIYVAIHAPKRPDICGRFEPDFPGCDCPDFDGVVVLSLASHQGVAAIPVGAPSDVVVHPNGQTAYVAAYDLLLVDTQRKEVVGAIPDIEATRLALRTDGKLLLAQSWSSVTAIATEDNRVVWTTTLASPAKDIAIGPDVIGSDVGATQHTSNPPQNGCQVTVHSNSSVGWLLLLPLLMLVGWRSRRMLLLRYSRWRWIRALAVLPALSQGGAFRGH